jgi:hypothetical protein
MLEDKNCSALIAVRAVQDNCTEDFWKRLRKKHPFRIILEQQLSIYMTVLTSLFKADASDLFVSVLALRLNLRGVLSAQLITAR